MTSLGGLANLNELVYSRYGDLRSWTRSDQNAFRATGSPATVVFVPGNGYSHQQTRDLGLDAYRRMMGELPPDEKIRFVIWSWPSDPASRRQVRDVRIKAGRTPWVAWCLASWLDTLEPAGPLCVVGTSFGARVVCEALHLRGGGTIGTYRLAPASTPRQRVQAVLISAAIDNDWLLPHRRLGRAISSVERMLLLTNSTDPVLSRYRLLYGLRSNAAALGYTGLAGREQLGAEARKIEQIDVASLVGPNHGFVYYFSAPRVVAQIQRYTISPNAPMLARNRGSAAR